MSDVSMSDILQRLRERKLVQWARAYGAAAFALIQVLDIVAQRFVWPEAAIRVAAFRLATHHQDASFARSPRP